ncbi:zincin [Zopfia rhizophila CBS 207.26]|uniref:Zincin n=1 Tax=Zopfia rhizophila CBS 207.26 TaxID=1314779 RepID=A0A6A6E7J6_9PEZI|nr:zincin [Zopfia rhizophila CBS 207.26]
MADLKSSIASPHPSSANPMPSEQLRDDISPEPLHMVVDDNLLWENGQIVRIKFLDDLSELQDKVKNIIRGVYQPLVHLTLEFVDGGQSDIRISFNEALDSHSFVGTAARCKKPEEHTLNLRVKTSTPQNTLERHVLHEFGHALGALHEHSSPNCPINWDDEKVYRSYKHDLGWDKKLVDLNVLRKESSADIRSSPFDPTSIMMYSFSPNLTRNGPFTRVNSGLSETDKYFISHAYPKPKEGQASSTALADAPRYRAKYSLITQRVRMWFYNLVNQAFRV